MSVLVTPAELERDAREFLRFKRAMGIAYQRAEFVLDSFVRFVAEHWGGQAEAPLKEAVTRWSARKAGRKAVAVGNEFGVIRQLCLYRRRHDPSGYVPEHALAPVKESIFLPYIFTQDEVRRLLAAATAHEGRFIWGGGGMLRPFMLVLYCTGVRLGEAVRLQCNDVEEPATTPAPTWHEAVERAQRCPSLRVPAYLRSPPAHRLGLDQC
jgi:integrase